MIFVDDEFYTVPKGKELKHYGIKGMKWGVRRYQNKDGSLTQLGREHYGVGGKEKSKSEFSVVKKAKVVKTTNSMNDLFRSHRELRNNRRFNRKVSKLLDSGKLDHVVKAHKEAMDAYDEYDKKYDKYSRLYPDWDGDGWELHEELMKKFPDYASANNKFEAAKKKAINAINDEVDNPDSPLREFDKYTDEYPILNAYTWHGQQHVNPVSWALGDLLDKRSGHYESTLGMDDDYAVDGWVGDEKGGA